MPNAETVQIGEQCWFAENLRADTYLNGDSIEYVSSAEAWSQTNNGAMFRHGGSVSESTGALYNWLAVDDLRGVCPSGWHVSSDAEWFTLNVLAGMPQESLDSAGWWGTEQLVGHQLKDPISWNGGEGEDVFGFGAQAGGWRNGGGGAGAVGSSGDWWTSDPPLPGGWKPIRRGLRADQTGNLRCRCSGWRDGFSVRCVQDSE